LITFDDGNVPFTYDPLQVEFADGTAPLGNSTEAAENSGFWNVATATDGVIVGYNRNEYSPATLYWAGEGESFILNSLYLASAWGTASVTITGYEGDGTVVGVQTLDLTLDAQFFEFNWEGLTSLEFDIVDGSYVFDEQFAESGYAWGPQWVLDDITINELTDEPPIDEPPGVPEPGVLALLGIGLVGFGAARRRKVA